MNPSDTHGPIPEDPKAFWEQRYAGSQTRERGKAGGFLQELVAGLPPGRVLELGCSTGDDSLWLAEQGWRVTAVDLSEHAVATARRLAREAGLSERIEFLELDLAQAFPEGQFELLCALYFQSPYDFPRAGILQTAASRILPGGHLLVVTHATGAPWSQLPHPDFEFPTLESELQDLSLSEADWLIESASVRKRIAKGPEGQEAELSDNLVFARRR